MAAVDRSIIRKYRILDVSGALILRYDLRSDSSHSCAHGVCMASPMHNPSSTAQMGIVGLPNVGKSSLFNLLTEQAIAAENYPFCTIGEHSSLSIEVRPRSDIHDPWHTHACMQIPMRGDVLCPILVMTSSAAYGSLPQSIRPTCTSLISPVWSRGLPRERVSEMLSSRT